MWEGEFVSRRAWYRLLAAIFAGYAAYGLYVVGPFGSDHHRGGMLASEDVWVRGVGWSAYLLPAALAVHACGRLVASRREAGRRVRQPGPSLRRLLVFQVACAVNALAVVAAAPGLMALLVAACAVAVMSLLTAAATRFSPGGRPPPRPNPVLVQALALSGSVFALVGVYVGAFALFAPALGPGPASVLLAVCAAGVAMRPVTAVLWPATERVVLPRLAGGWPTDRADGDDDRVAAAREEERRRLRHDLHDGLGPALASIRIRLETAAASLAQHPKARALVACAAAETARTVEEVRRLLDDLRPVDLDRVGLPMALRRLVARMDGAGPAVVADVPDTAADLPPATELAAYRIAAEGLTNAVRHAAARQVRVRLAVRADHVLLDVVDDGVSLPPVGRGPRGLGLSSMARRAAEVGGHCVVLPRPDGRPGTLVRAVLPRHPR